MFGGGQRRQQGKPKITINRMKANKFIQKGLMDNTGGHTVFGQIFDFFKHRDLKQFAVKQFDTPFTTAFVGEGSIDVGGPYREAISQMCTELQSTALPLLIPSPNQKHDNGLFREKWVLNPSAQTTTHMKMFEFLGVLFGTSIRTKNFLSIDLPSIVWKGLIGQKANRQDLENIDRFSIQCLDNIVNIGEKDITEDNFNDYFQDRFITYLSDGSEVELMEGGKEKLVIWENRKEYSEYVEKTRLNESQQQVLAIRKGLIQVVPEGLISLLTWRELQKLVCGNPIMDVELLKMNTTYRGCSEKDPVVQNFWKVLSEFTAEERAMYLRFVWGRSRLPLTSKDFSMKHRIEM